ncbi:hypothetical protein RLOC_00002010 [Lonchura striata]|uniref:Uncharacterized protein n=1 Tax=Lonchura striata TaxID=40157 RepID=A0A218V278_9PASE|nr:hypothetical protein RLOC_00002010 [Lonchura striata domestica]
MDLQRVLMFKACFEALCVAVFCFGSWGLTDAQILLGAVPAVAADKGKEMETRGILCQSSQFCCKTFCWKLRDISCSSQSSSTGSLEEELRK